MSPSPKDISSSSTVHSPSELFCIDILRDDAPYCEKDFQIHFGVKCEACHQFITGKVLEAKVDNEILDYKDLAAIPKVKAIYDIERPDLITYEPFYSITEESQERQSLGEGYHDMRERMIHRSTSQGSISSPIYSRHNYTPTLPRSPQHFHRPELLSSPAVQRLPYLHTSSFSSSHNDSRPTSPFRHHFIPHNKDAAVQIKSAEDIIKSAKFPAAFAPSPEDTAKIETDHWPCPPSLAAIGHDTRRHSREEEEEEMQKRRQIQEEHLSKCGLSNLTLKMFQMQSGLGKLILKEEMEKEMTQERYSRSISAQRYDSPQTDSCKSDQKASMTSSLPGYGRNGLHRPQSTDFSQYNSYGDVCGGLKEFQVCNE
ncbi:UNVERIFIED_CONTAM: hypothetical protein FKN15_019992 [Acipenser sinensis]